MSRNAMRPRRTPIALALAATLVSALAFGAPSQAARGTSLRLVAPSNALSLLRVENEPASLGAAVYVAATGSAFEVRLERDAYDEPVVATLSGRKRKAQRLPSDLLAGWLGLARFLQITVKDPTGGVVVDETRTFCPNNFLGQRLSDEGPISQTYPEDCRNFPFLRGNVWGIDKGWAVPALGFAEDRFDIGDGRYTVTFAITERYRDLLGISAEDATATVQIELTSVPFEEPVPEPGFEDPGSIPLQAGPTPGSSATSRPTSAVKDVGRPSPASLPDLAALPAYGFSIFPQGGREQLAFAATEWNAGPQPVVVEGFRRPGSEVMDAYQYFIRKGRAVGRAKVGTMIYHAGGGHDHWHFTQFTRYSLLDAEMNELQPSGKQSWCLVPSDPVDLTVRRALYRPGNTSLETACGEQTSLWVREVLPVGWGDTYYQGLAGQSFDITGLPNGDYFVRVEVNPDELLHERSRENNVELRRITISGAPGGRVVSAEPWNGIDTEAGCCFVGNPVDPSVPLPVDEFAGP